MKQISSITSLMILISIFASCSPIQVSDNISDNTPFSEKFLAYDGVAGDGFGGVAISGEGNTIIVGAPGDDDMGTDSGSIYRFHWNGSAWETNKFVAYDGAAGYNFGCRVSVSTNGNSIVTAASENGVFNYSGSIYRFHWNGSLWETNKFVAYDGATWDLFGSSVAISADGNTIVAGACGDEDMGSLSGSIYRFHWNGSAWETNKLVAYDGVAGDGFGYSVAISSDGNTIVAGASTDDDKGSFSGSAYIFSWNGSSWVTKKVVAFDGAVLDQFGSSVAVSSDGKTVVAGACNNDDNGSDSGSIYRFKWNGSAWIASILLSYDGKAEDFWALALQFRRTGILLLQVLTVMTTWALIQVRSINIRGKFV